MNDQRLEIVVSAQTIHFGALPLAQIIRGPLARVGRENLESVRAQAVGAFGGVLYPSGGRCVYANVAGGQAGRAFGWAATEDVLFAGEGAGHEKSIAGSDRFPGYGETVLVTSGQQGSANRLSSHAL